MAGLGSKGSCGESLFVNDTQPVASSMFQWRICTSSCEVTWTRLLQEEGSQYKSPQSCPREGMVKGAQLSCIYNSKNCPCRRPKKCLSSLCDSPCGKQACTSWIFQLKWLSSLCVPSFLRVDCSLLQDGRLCARELQLPLCLTLGELWCGVRRQRLVQTGNTGPPLENPQAPFLFLWEGQVLGTMQHLGFRLKNCYQSEFCPFLSHVTCKVNFCYAIRKWENLQMTTRLYWSRWVFFLYGSTNVASTHLTTHIQCVPMYLCIIFAIRKSGSLYYSPIILLATFLAFNLCV